VVLMVVSTFVVLTVKVGWSTLSAMVDRSPGRGYLPLVASRPGHTGRDADRAQPERRGPRRQ
jgi:hypothetical protein